MFLSSHTAGTGTFHSCKLVNAMRLGTVACVLHAGDFVRYCIYFRGVCHPEIINFRRTFGCELRSLRYGDIIVFLKILPPFILVRESMNWSNEYK